MPPYSDVKKLDNTKLLFPEFLNRILLTGLLITLLFNTGEASVIAQQEDGYWFAVQELGVEELGTPQFSGIAFSSITGAILLPDDFSDPTNIHLKTVDHRGHPLGSYDLPSQEVDPVLQPIDEFVAASYLLDMENQRIYQIQSGIDTGQSIPYYRVKKYVKNPFGVKNILGVSGDPGTGNLYILDAGGPAIVKVIPNKLGDGGPSGSEGKPRIERINLPFLKGQSLNGLAYNPGLSLLYVYSESEKKIIAVNEAGQLTESLDLIDLELENIQGMVFANSTDPTDDPDQMNLFLADEGSRSRVIELSLTEINPPEFLAESISTSVVRVIDTSIWSPASPDPAGIEYLLATNRLFVVDSEVDEMTIYQGKNTFTSSNAGTLISSCTTLSFSDEPTGTAVNPANGEMSFCA
jgi:hypothetical protein